MFLGGPDGLPASRPAGIDALLVFPVVAVVVPVLSMISLSCRPGCPSAASLSLISRTGLQRYCFFLYFQIFSHFFPCFFPAASGSGTVRTLASPWTAHGYDSRPKEEKNLKKILHEEDDVRNPGNNVRLMNYRY